MILLSIAEALLSLLILGAIITQIIIPGLFPSVFGPNFFWLFRRGSKQREIDALRQKLAEAEQELAAQKLREQLEREKKGVGQTKPKNPVNKKPQTQKPPASAKSDDDPASFAQ